MPFPRSMLQVLVVSDQVFTSEKVAVLEGVVGASVMGAADGVVVGLATMEVTFLGGFVLGIYVHAQGCCIFGALCCSMNGFAGCYRC